MRHGFAAALIGIALVLPLANANAQETGHSCAAAATLPAELAGWPSQRPIMAASGVSDLRSATLQIGSATDATLKPTADIRYVTRPEEPGGSVSYGGLFNFTVSRAGTYQVALGSGAWIDVLKGKTALTSTAHGHGPDCSGIRKMVSFELTPGRYTLQVAANGEPTLALMIAQLP
ncbi:MAG: homogentisate 1,2-dioxygenase [Novosphingobium sp.]